MSGGYAIPYLFQNKAPKHVIGWVPIAPVSITTHSAKDYKTKLNFLKHTFIVYGENDKRGKQNSLDYLAEIPNSETFQFDGGSHPCYMDDKELWNEKLVEFLGKF